MQLPNIVICAALSGAACFSQDTSGLLGSFVTPDRATLSTNQTLTGAWATLGRRAAIPGTPIPPPAPIFLVFHADGNMTGYGADSSFSGVWTRVAERKFLVTYFAFNYNEARAVTSIGKNRLTTQISADGNSLEGTQEVVVFDPDGQLLFTALVRSHTSVRVTPEKPANYDAFLLND